MFRAVLSEYVEEAGVIQREHADPGPPAGVRFRAPRHREHRRRATSQEVATVPGSYMPIHSGMLNRISDALPVRPFNLALMGPFAQHSRFD